MLNDKILQLIRDTGESLGLEDAIIEKDYYVTQVIHLLSNTEDEYFRLVFAGGTCLAKGHKIVKRMSEDIDFKIQLKDIGINFSKTRLLKELKQFRALITSKLTIPGLTTRESIVCNEGNYSQIKMNYPSIFHGSTTLRSEILLEFTLSDIQLSMTNLIIKTLIEETFEDVIIFNPPVRDAYR